LIDDGGRSPSRQLNDAAEELERFLNRRRQPLRIRRVVLFTHPRSSCGTFTTPTVDLITTSTGDIAVLCEAEREAITSRQVAKLERLIVKDHRFNEEQLKRRSRTALKRARKLPPAIDPTGSILGAEVAAVRSESRPY